MSASEHGADTPDFSGAWESDEQVFEDGCRFALALERARAWCGGIPDSGHAEELIRHFCGKVRRSPDTLLGCLARAYKLDNVGIMATALVLLAYASSHGNFNMFYVGTMACGLSIVDLARFRKHIENRTGFMRVIDKFDANLFPKPGIIHMGQCDDLGWRKLRDEIAALPTREQRDK